MKSFARPLRTSLRNLQSTGGDTFVGTAATDVATEPVLYFFKRGFRFLIQKRSRRHHKTWRAEAALHGVVLNKPGDDFVELIAIAKRFHRLDVLPLNFDGQTRACINGFAVDDDGVRTGTTGCVEVVFAAGQVELIPQCVEQRCPWFDRQLVLLAVDGQCDVNFAGTLNRGLAFLLSQCFLFSGGNGGGGDRRA